MDQDALAAALLSPSAYPHAAEKVERLETHISNVFLAGDFAYKVKKPVRFPFLDFSTLEARRRCCEEELRVNRRYAPRLYLDVVEIRGSDGRPRIGGEGPVLDYAVRMRRFRQDSLASALLERGALTARLLTDFAGTLSAFHASLPGAGAGSGYGTPESVLHYALANFDEISDLVTANADCAALAALRNWTEREFLLQYPAFKRRHAGGMVRECHGDLHLRNIVEMDGRLVPFDGIDFEPALRWTDVMSEAAFLAMDLIDRGAPRLAWTFLSEYLEPSGDYDGVRVLRFYLVYRAMVRAKVHLLRSMQTGLEPAESERLLRAFRDYVALAQRSSLDMRPAVVLMHGFSGSGKSVIAAALVPEMGAIRIRSDVERKRLHRLAAHACSGSPAGSGIYAANASDSTYARLAEAAAAVAGSGYPAIVDATFIRSAHRNKLAQAAREVHVPLALIDVDAPLELLRRRVAERQDDASEATVEVLERQIAAAEPIAPDENLTVLSCDGTRNPAEVAESLAASLAATAQ